MNQEELTKAISNGIFKGYAKIIWSIAIALFLVAIIVTGIILYTNYENSKCVKNNNCPIMGTAMPMDKCILGRISCSIIQINPVEKQPIILIQKSICGWQEANEWFKYVKEFVNYNKENQLIMGCY